MMVQLPNELLNEPFWPGTVKNFPCEFSKFSLDFKNAENILLDVGVKPCRCIAFC